MSVYHFTHERPAELVETVEAMVRRPWPWHVLLTAPHGHVRIQAREGTTGGRYWETSGTVVVPASGTDAVRLVAHELGHAIDTLALTEEDRDEVRRIFGVPIATPWKMRRDLTHYDVTGEAFAEWFAYEHGHTPRRSLGPHRWGEVGTRDRLKELVMSAGSQVQAFGDVPPDSTHADAINWAAARGLLSGYPDGTFGPHDPVTRGQLASILRAYDEEKGTP